MINDNDNVHAYRYSYLYFKGTTVPVVSDMVTRYSVYGICDTLYMAPTAIGMREIMHQVYTGIVYRFRYAVLQ